MKISQNTQMRLMRAIMINLARHEVKHPEMRGLGHSILRQVLEIFGETACLHTPDGMRSMIEIKIEQKAINDAANNYIESDLRKGNRWHQICGSSQVFFWLLGSEAAKPSECLSPPCRQKCRHGGPPVKVSAQ